MTISPVTSVQRIDEGGPAARPAAGAVAAAGAQFSAALDAAAAPAAPIPGKGPQAAKPDQLQQFEGFVLRSFVEAMLPKENTSFFGSGTAGGIWRSMMAERLGEELAASGGIGIAELLAEGSGTGEALRTAEAARDAGTATSFRPR